MDNDAHDLRVGDSAARLIALGDFEVFLEEVERRRELVVHNAMVMRCESYDEYLSLQAEYKALTTIIEMPRQLADVALDIREQYNGSE